MNLEDIKCQVCRAAPILFRCTYCGRWVCAACLPDVAEPCRGCFELDDTVEAAGPDRPRQQPPAQAQAKSVCDDRAVVCNPQRNEAAYPRTFDQVLRLIHQQDAAGDPPRLN